MNDPVGTAHECMYDISSYTNENSDDCIADFSNDLVADYRNIQLVLLVS